MHITRKGWKKGESGSYKNWPAGCWSMPSSGGQRRLWYTYGCMHCAWLIPLWMRHLASRTLTRRSHRWYFQDPKWTQTPSIGKLSYAWSMLYTAHSKPHKRATSVQSKGWRVGVYLGKSPIHFKNVALVLPLNTGLASPKFLVKFDTQYQKVGQE